MAAVKLYAHIHLEYRLQSAVGGAALSHHHGAPLSLSHASDRARAGGSSRPLRRTSPEAKPVPAAANTAVESNLTRPSCLLVHLQPRVNTWEYYDLHGAATSDIDLFLEGQSNTFPLASIPVPVRIAFVFDTYVAAWAVKRVSAGQYLRNVPFSLLSFSSSLLHRVSSNPCPPLHPCPPGPRSQR